MPSLGEAPSGGAESLWLLWVGRHSGLSKVSRCKSGTASGHTRSNGYAHRTAWSQVKSVARFSEDYAPVRSLAMLNSGYRLSTCPA